jgi:hypothetical protein
MIKTATLQASADKKIVTLIGNGIKKEKAIASKTTGSLERVKRVNGSSKGGEMMIVEDRSSHSRD